MEQLLLCTADTNGRKLRLTCHWQDGQSVEGETALQGKK